MSGWSGQPGVLHVGTASARALVLDAEAAGGLVFAIPPVTSKAALLDALAELLRFPGWAGRNWDATAELLSDLSWLAPGPVTVLWSEPETLADNDPAAYRMAVEILGRAAHGVRSVVLTIVLAHRGLP